MKLTTEEICKNALYCIEQTRGTTEMLLEDLEYESVIEQYESLISDLKRYINQILQNEKR